MSAEPISTLTQSRFYSAAFNAAIFDGPIRIYFTQYQESQALKIYFGIQERLKERRHQLQDEYKKNGTHIFVMLYPTDEVFAMSFVPEINQNIAEDRLGGNYVLGIRGPLLDEQLDGLFDRLEVIAESC